MALKRLISGTLWGTKKQNKEGKTEGTIVYTSLRGNLRCRDKGRNVYNVLNKALDTIGRSYNYSK